MRWCRVYDDALERGVRRAERIARRTRSTGKTLSHVLATYFCVPAASRPFASGGRGRHTALLCGAIGAAKSRSRAQGERATPFLPAWGVKYFSPMRSVARWQSSAEKDRDSSRSRNSALTIGPRWNQPIPLTPKRFMNAGGL